MREGGTGRERVRRGGTEVGRESEGKGGREGREREG